MKIHQLLINKKQKKMIYNNKINDINDYLLYSLYYLDHYIY